MLYFDAGDEVQCIDPGNNNALCLGRTYTVEKFFSNSNNSDAGLVFLQGIPGRFYAYRFRLAVVAKTDEELADEYRELRAKAREIGDTLNSRGYTSYFKTEGRLDWTPMNRAKTEYRFTKTEQKVI